MNDSKSETQNKEITKDYILFFDMDGTLVDTNYANFLAYKIAIQFVTKSSYDIAYNPDRRFNRSYLKEAIPNLTQTDYEKIIQHKEEFYKDFLHETVLNSETIEILLKYSNTNKTVLVSNCRKDRAIMTLKYLRIADKFNHIFCREFGEKDKKINKFQNAISKLDIQPHFVIAFENEESEIIDAQNAGISIINPTYL